MVGKWLSGALNHVEDPMKNLGKKDQYIKAAVRGQEDTQLYHVGIYRFNAQNGLYIIAGYNKADDLQLLENLLSAISYTGIGGKKEVDWEDLRGRKQKRDRFFNEVFKSGIGNKDVVVRCIPAGKRTGSIIRGRFIFVE